MIDLRSDTVTLPSAEMMQCICKAELGDDLRGEDPTVNRLQELAAEITGKEAALLTASGTMGNLIAHMTHCRPGDEVIVGDGHHTMMYEVGAPASVAGVSFRILPLDGAGAYDLDSLEQAVRTAGLDEPRTGLIWIENTFAGEGGVVVPLDELSRISAVAKEHSLPVHMDGARVHNAATYLAVEVSEITQYADTVSFCLSKGLAAPIGSMLCGPRDFITEARRNRQKLGGGMRQAGIIAAAGIYAIEKMSLRLQEDHDNARFLAEGLLGMPGLLVDPAAPQTNFVLLRLTSGRFSRGRLAEVLKESGVLVGLWTKGRLRLVTHYGIERKDIESALEVFDMVMTRYG